MSQLYHLYFAVYFVGMLSVVHALTSLYLPPASCVEPQSKTINVLANLANKFKEINLCDFTAVKSQAVLDNEGRWIVSYRINTTVNNESEAEKLCECMKNYLFKSDWTEGAIHVCKCECTSLTLCIIGARNPEFIGLKSSTETCEPIKVLGLGLEKYSDAQLGGKNCKSKTGRTKTGQYLITAECDNDPQPEKICSIMYDYLNAENWLDTTTTHSCYVKNNKLYLEIVEKTILLFYVYVLCFIFYCY